MLTVTYAECHIFALYAERRYAQCRGDLMLNVIMLTVVKLNVMAPS